MSMATVLKITMSLCYISTTTIITWVIQICHKLLLCLLPVDYISFYITRCRSFYSCRFLHNLRTMMNLLSAWPELLCDVQSLAICQVSLLTIVIVIYTFCAATATVRCDQCRDDCVTVPRMRSVSRHIRWPTMVLASNGSVFFKIPQNSKIDHIKLLLWTN